MPGFLLSDDLQLLRTAASGPESLTEAAPTEPTLATTSSGSSFMSPKYTKTGMPMIELKQAHSIEATALNTLEVIKGPRSEQV
jgi:hypothetical protein